jgi:putative ATPase
VNSALLSRCRVYTLRPLDAGSLRAIAEDALVGGAAEQESGEPPRLEEAAWSVLLAFADGDARKALNLIEALLPAAGTREEISAAEVERVIQSGVAVRHGAEDHFDWISALHKSLRGSDPHAGLYWLARMLEAGEDPKFIVRRLIVFASEDVGLADPGALVYATAAMQAVDFVGMPECRLALSELVLYLALAPKSNSTYASYSRAQEQVHGRDALPVPLRIRNAPTRLMNDLGYGRGYVYPHEAPGRWVPESYLPDEIRAERFFRPSRQGREARMVEDHRRRTRDFYDVRSNDADPTGTHPS